MSWKYDLGKWEKVELKDLGIADMEEDEDFHEWVNRVGFYHHASHREGMDNSFNFSVYSSHNQQRFLVDVSVNQDVNLVLIEGLPSFLSFLKEYRDLFKNSCEFVQDDNWDWIRKDQIKRIFRRGNKEEVRVYAEMLDGTQVTIRKHNHQFINQVLEEEFGIQ